MQRSGKEGIRDLYLCEDGTLSEDPSLCKGKVLDFLDYRRRLSLSKLLSGILRHYPWRVGVGIDPKGWVDLKSLVNGINSLRDYEWVKEWHIRAIVAFDPKGRFEIKGNRIRARYGHTLPVKVEPLPGPIPERLYHGTPIENLRSILREGIKKMKRNKVHLANSFDSAVEVGARRSNIVVVFEIDSSCLLREGFKVEKASNIIFIVDYVPPKCIINYKVIKVQK